jgi:hypothetical protein
MLGVADAVDASVNDISTASASAAAIARDPTDRFMTRSPGARCFEHPAFRGVALSAA